MWSTVDEARVKRLHKLHKVYKAALKAERAILTEEEQKRIKGCGLPMRRDVLTRWIKEEVRGEAPAWARTQGKTEQQGVEA